MPPGHTSCQWLNCIQTQMFLLQSGCLYTIMRHGRALGPSGGRVCRSGGN